MDSLRGNFPGLESSEDDELDYDLGEDEVDQEVPPLSIGQDERRMQVRAYNFWASLLDNRNFPSVEDLDPENLPDFGPHSVLLDFSGGIENPAIQFLGDKLARECGTDGEITQLSDVPSRSLLSRITDHYMQILANQAPIGFEAEFVNQRGSTILYRGILLPFSSDDDTIDFIYGVINWKEMADQQTTDALMIEIDQAIEAMPDVGRADTPITEWADSPVDDDGVLDLVMPFDGGDDEDQAWPAPAFADEVAPLPGSALKEHDDVLDLAGLASEVDVFDDDGSFHDSIDEVDALDDLDDLDEDELIEEAGVLEGPSLPLTGFGHAATVAEPVAEIADEGDSETQGDVSMELADWLASARELALAAQGTEDRSRHALYAAIGRAYDFSLAAADQPADFAELLEDAGLTAQDRAPMTPVVKLVFGADYDKTRLTEFASALGHAQRLGLERGALSNHLAVTPGGLKAVVAAERRIKREESGKGAEVRDTPRMALARRLRKLAHQPLAEVSAEGSEFTLLVARRLPDGRVVLLGEVGDDISLLERAARKLVG